MPALDRLLDAMDRHGAPEVVLQSGKPVCLTSPEGSRPLNGKELSSKQIFGILAEVAPPEFKEQFRAQPNLSFQYSPSAGPRPVVVDLVRTQNALQAKLRWAPTGEASAVAEEAGELDLPEEPAGTSAGPPPAATPTAGAEPAPAAEASPFTAPTAGFEGRPAIDRLFQVMVDTGSSDLHLSVGNPPLLRHDGSIKPVHGWETFTDDALRKLLYEIAPEKNVEEFEETNDTDFAYAFGDVCRFRSNLYRDHKGVAGCFRQIPNEILPYDKLGLPQKVLDLCFLSKGLVVVTGPTGSGKSTTLASMIDYINDHRNDHIITIEDPIEFVHPNKECLIHQREVGEHTQGFKRALRAALREDPDIVLVGEMRDLETVAIAIETAETGHLVFGTLHTNTAASTVDRIIDQFPGDRQGQIRVMLSETLKGVIAQTLCKRKGGGRIAAYEVLFGVQSVSNLIREGKTFQIPSIMQAGRKHGMVTMNQSLLQHVKDDLVTPAEAYLKSVDQQDMLTQFQKANIAFDPSKHGSDA